MGNKTATDTPPRAGRTRWVGMPGSWQAGFLAALAACGNVSQAARAMGINRQHAHHTRRTCPALATAWQAALEEAEATRRLRVLAELTQPAPGQPAAPAYDLAALTSAERTLLLQLARKAAPATA